ncbi:hypothetical protein Hjap01_03821 [Haloarcula japonica]
MTDSPQESVNRTYHSSKGWRRFFSFFGIRSAQMQRDRSDDN